MTIVGAILLSVVLLASSPNASAETLTGPSVTQTVIVRKGGIAMGPFPAVEGAVYALPALTSCGGVTLVMVPYAPSGERLADVEAEIMAHVRERADGAGCELVVDRERHVERPIDLEHDPRVRRDGTPTSGDDRQDNPPR